MTTSAPSSYGPMLCLQEAQIIPLSQMGAETKAAVSNFKSKVYQISFLLFFFFPSYCFPFLIAGVCLGGRGAPWEVSAMNCCIFQLAGWKAFQGEPQPFGVRLDEFILLKAQMGRWRY